MKRILKSLVVAAVVACASMSYAHHGPGPRYHHHHSFWGHGGRNFWPGFAAGFVGCSMLHRPYYPAPVVVPPLAPVVVAPAPVVVQPAPVVVPQRTIIVR